jgi:hypothetical protein
VQVALLDVKCNQPLLHRHDEQQGAIPGSADDREITGGDAGQPAVVVWLAVWLSVRQHAIIDPMQQLAHDRVLFVACTYSAGAAQAAAARGAAAPAA